MDVGRPPKPEAVADMIQDPEPVLAFGGAQTAADFLHEQDSGLGRLRIDQARDQRQV